MSVYNKSPYYMRVSMWNLLSVNISLRNSNTKAQFKYEIRERLKKLGLNYILITIITDTDSS